MSDAIRYDLLLVGGSSSNLILAHRLLDLVKLSGLKLSIALLEKARQFGGHIISGAICNPQVIARLFPDFESQGFPHEGRVEVSHLSVLGSQERWDLPEAAIPKGLRKQGQFILTLSHVIRWLAETLQEKAKGIPNVTLDVFPGFAAHEILYDGERVIGVRVSDSGQVYEDCVFAELTCFGDKGFISKDLVEKFHLRPRPQLWSVGVKELWQIPCSLQGQVWHTLGYPVLDGSFSGGFVYGLKDNRLALGLIIGLDTLFYGFLLVIPVAWGLSWRHWDPWIPALPTLGLNILSSNPAYRDLVHQYALPVVPFLFLAVIENGKTTNPPASSAKVNKTALIWSLLAFLALAKYTFFGSLYLQSLDTWQATREALAQIATSGGVLTTHEISPHLTHRRVIYFTDESRFKGSPPDQWDPFDYVLLNSRHPGWRSSPEFSQTLIAALQNETSFRLLYHRDGVYLFSRLRERS
jgi:hypothetical protein